MKKLIKIWIYSLAIMGVFLLLTSSCKKADDNNNPATVTDIDGNVYHTITIGTQVWLAENLKTTKFNDGSSIPLLTKNAARTDLTTPEYWWYNNDSATYDNPYGKLYNWYAVNDGRDLCPTGWHVPTDAEWTTLTDYLGGLSVAGGKLKETGFIHWSNGNVGATNESGFTALPGGDRDINGSFNRIGLNGRWWSSSMYGSTGKAWYREMGGNHAGVIQANSSPDDGYSVRCIGD